MKQIFSICLLLILSSCFNNERSTSEMDLLNQRINRLEQRIDSLINGKNYNTNSIESSHKIIDNSSSYNNVQHTGRCQATTKKGTQCKRSAKQNGYCWQHGG